MNSLKTQLLIVVTLLGALSTPCAIFGQAPDAQMLLHPPADSWPGYHGDYTGRRHSALTQITPQNVKSLSLAWAFQTSQVRQIKSSPLLVDGILYFTVPENIWAVDARSGHQIWHYTHPRVEGEHLGHRGVAMYKGYLYFVTPNAHLVSLNAKDGTVRWEVEIGDQKKGYWSSMAPLVVKDHVIAGVGGDLDNITGYIRAFDPESGAVQWQFDTTPPAGTTNATTGGMTWMTGTYDPELNLTYWGTGNPTPVLTGATRPGDNLYTCSIIALNPDTGKLAWAFQVSPHDTHDWDAVEIPVLVDGNFRGQPKKMLMQTSRNGYFFVLDRTNGKSLLTVPYGPVNWATGIDKEGRPIPNPEKEPAPDGRLIAPDEGGLTNYRSPSVDTKRGLFVVSAHPSWSIYFSKSADGTYGWSGADYGVWGTGQIDAIDYQTGKIRWTHDLGDEAGSGVLTTDSGLTFTGDSRGNFLALDTSDGKTLWHAGSGAQIAGSPLTYQLDGRQYVVTSSGSVMFAWALPE
jgi:alcohol dehydrogenase (cytochrome c)